MKTLLKFSSAKCTPDEDVIEQIKELRFQLVQIEEQINGTNII